MKQQSGFTLIELVVVIIVLGILAVTAAPKFIDLQSDARTATLKGVEGALKGANGMVYAKAAIAGKEGETTVALNVDGKDGDEQLKFGYANAHKATLEAVLDLSGEWTIENDDDDAPTKAFIHQSGATYDKSKTGADDASCHLIYVPAASKGAQPTYTLVTGKC